MKEKTRIEITIDIDKDGAPSIDGGLYKGEDFQDNKVRALMYIALNLHIRQAIDEWIQRLVGDKYVTGVGKDAEEAKANSKIAEDIFDAGRQPPKFYDNDIGTGGEGDPGDYGDE